MITLLQCITATALGFWTSNNCKIYGLCLIGPPIVGSSPHSLQMALWVCKTPKPIQNLHRHQTFSFLLIPKPQSSQLIKLFVLNYYEVFASTVSQKVTITYLTLHVCCPFSIKLLPPVKYSRSSLAIVLSLVSSAGVSMILMQSH